MVDCPYLPMFHVLIQMHAVTDDEIKKYVQVYGLRTHGILGGKPVRIELQTVLII